MKLVAVVEVCLDVSRVLVAEAGALVSTGKLLDATGVAVWICPLAEVLAGGKENRFEDELQESEWINAFEELKAGGELLTT